MNDSVQSGADYAAILIGVMAMTESELPIDDKMPEELFDLWTLEIQEHADKTWTDYIVGNRSDYSFSEDEMKNLYEKALSNYTSLILHNLVDKDMVEVSIGEDGELLYGLTEKGKKAVEKNDKN